MRYICKIADLEFAQIPIHGSDVDLSDEFSRLFFKCTDKETIKRFPLVS
jgi:hypothetical protein